MDRFSERIRRRQMNKLSFLNAKRLLYILNCMYVISGLLLIFTAAYAKSASIVTSVSLAGGLIAVGIFVVCVSILGFYGTYHQHQAVLFFYMTILFVVFIVQFCISIACYANSTSSDYLIEAGWKSSSVAMKHDAQKAFDCCGLEPAVNNTGEVMSSCKELSCYPKGCASCLEVISNATNDNIARIGLFSIFISLSELFGVAMAYKFRNIRNPDLNPDSLF